MKLLLPPPSVAELLARHGPQPAMAEHALEVNGRYEHWDHLRHLTPPQGLSTEVWWLNIKSSRIAASRPLLLYGRSTIPLRLVVTDTMLRRLHFLDREAAGSIRGLTRNDDPRVREGYLLRSLIEEAMTSSQLEGASTTREIAKAMLRSGRAPRDRSEQMIYNNFIAMRELRRWQDDPLTPDRVFEIHRLLCTDALDDRGAAGRFRRADEPIRVVDNPDGTVLHDPPDAAELPERMARLCRFANDLDSRVFLHPVIRAIVLHFQIGFDHPFVDGNGRTARALFYWSMLRAGYWLTEFLSISSVLRKAPAQYSRSFQYTETDGYDVSYFVDHQLEVLEKSVDGLRGYLDRKQAERMEAEQMLKPNSKLAPLLNHRQRALLSHALRYSGRRYRIAEHQREHGVTYQTARTDLLRLAELGLMQHFQEGKAFVFVAPLDLGKRLQRPS
jgi:Fic family protein